MGGVQDKSATTVLHADSYTRCSARPPGLIGMPTWLGWKPYGTFRRIVQLLLLISGLTLLPAAFESPVRKRLVASFTMWRSVIVMREVDERTSRRLRQAQVLGSA